MIRISNAETSIGAVAVSSPSPDELRSYLDELDHIKRIDIDDRLYYVPIGVLYEATLKPKKEDDIK